MNNMNFIPARRGVVKISKVRDLFPDTFDVDISRKRIPKVDMLKLSLEFAEV